MKNENTPSVPGFREGQAIWQSLRGDKEAVGREDLLSV